MKIDPSYAVLMGVIIGLLMLVYAVATFTRSRKRRIERAMLESVIQARETPDEPTPETPAAVAEPPPHTLPAAPVVNPTPPKPRPRVLITWVPPPSEGPHRFNQYITWPGAKIVTPVAERSPAKQDYVWE